MHESPHIWPEVLNTFEPETRCIIWHMFQKIWDKVATTIEWKLNDIIKTVRYFYRDW